MKLDGKKYVEVMKSMFMVYMFLLCFFGDYIWEKREIILFFCINFACHENHDKNARELHCYRNRQSYDELNKRYKLSSAQQCDECVGPEKRTTICLKVGYTYLVTTKVVYTALYLIQKIEEMALII